HIAAVVSQSNMTLYANGALQGVETNAGLARLRGDPVNRLGVVGFEGDMDDVRLWKIARTAEEIRADQFTQLSGNEPGLMAWWNSDDDTAHDATTNHYDGKLAGGARIVPGAPNMPTSFVSTGAVQTEHTTAAGVLELTGTNSYVELPPNLIRGCRELTVEGW